MICKDQNESSYASYVYSKSLKFGEPFSIEIQTYRGAFISQAYDRFGNPVGKPENIIM